MTSANSSTAIQLLQIGEMRTWITDQKISTVSLKKNPKKAGKNLTSLPSPGPNCILDIIALIVTSEIIPEKAYINNVVAAVSSNHKRSLYIDINAVSAPKSKENNHVASSGLQDNNQPLQPIAVTIKASRLHYLTYKLPTLYSTCMTAL